MKTVTYRPATTKDIPVIEKLHSALMNFEHRQLGAPSSARWPFTTLSKKYRRQNIRSKNGYLVLVEVNGKPIGFFQGWVGPAQQWRHPERIAELSLMYIEKKYRGRGIGTRLIKDFLTWAKKRGAKQLTLVVVEKNAVAKRLYKQFGFTTVFETMERKA